MADTSPLSPTCGDTAKCTEAKEDGTTHHQMTTSKQIAKDLRDMICDAHLLCRCTRNERRTLLEAHRGAWPFIFDIQSLLQLDTPASALWIWKGKVSLHGVHGARRGPWCSVARPLG